MRNVIKLFGGVFYAFVEYACSIDSLEHFHLGPIWHHDQTEQPRQKCPLESSAIAYFARA